MASIADIEQLLEQVFERSTTRLFRTRVQPVQLEHRVERAMERARVSRGSRTEVPARYRVRVHPADLEGLAPNSTAAQALAARLADGALGFARAHAYHLARRPGVAVVADPSLQRGRVAVDVDEAPVGGSRRQAKAPDAAEPAAAVDPVAGVASEPDEAPSAPGGAPSAPERSLSGPSPAGRPLGKPPSVPAAGSATNAASVAIDPQAGEPAALGIRGDSSQTHVFRRPSPAAARAVLRMIDPNGQETSIEVDGRPLTIGRARDNGLIIGDARVSRHHGRLLARHGALVYADLDSTNGSRVNGVRVDEIALGVGDRILVGDTVLVVELLPG